MVSLRLSTNTSIFLGTWKGCTILPSLKLQILHCVFGQWNVLFPGFKGQHVSCSLFSPQQLWKRVLIRNLLWPNPLSSHNEQNPLLALGGPRVCKWEVIVKNYWYLGIFVNEASYCPSCLIQLPIYPFLVPTGQHSPVHSLRSPRSGGSSWIYRSAGHCTRSLGFEKSNRSAPWSTSSLEKPPGECHLGTRVKCELWCSCFLWC